MRLKGTHRLMNFCRTVPVGSRRTDSRRYTAADRKPERNSELHFDAADTMGCDPWTARPGDRCRFECTLAAIGRTYPIISGCILDNDAASAPSTSRDDPLIPSSSPALFPGSTWGKPQLGPGLSPMALPPAATLSIRLLDAPAVRYGQESRWPQWVLRDVCRHANRPCSVSSPSPKSAKSHRGRNSGRGII